MNFRTFRLNLLNEFNLPFTPIFKFSFFHALSIIGYEILYKRIHNIYSSSFSSFVHVWLPCQKIHDKFCIFYICNVILIHLIVQLIFSISHVDSCSFVRKIQDCLSLIFALSLQRKYICSTIIVTLTSLANQTHIFKVSKPVNHLIGFGKPALILCFFFLFLFILAVKNDNEANTINERY